MTDAPKRTVGEIEESIDEWLEIRERAVEQGKWHVVGTATDSINTLRWVLGYRYPTENGLE